MGYYNGKKTVTVFPSLADYAKIDGYYALLGAGVADNLRGRASSAVPAFFTFRTSGGTADIGNPKATIRSIHGKTLKWTQLVGALTPSSINDLTVSFTGGVLTVSGTASASTNLKLVDGDDFVNGHKYLICGVPAGGSSSTYGGYWSNSGMFYADNIITYNSNGSLNIRIINGATVSFSCILQLFDLTATFGAGNEPSTVAAFKALFQLNYYAYNAGSLLNFNGTGLKTVGFQQWDEQWESGSINNSGNNAADPSRIRSKNYIPVFPSTSYYLKAPQNAKVFFYDANKIYISSLSSDKNFTFSTVANARYMRFYVFSTTQYKNDICINMSHSGYRNGEYEPYWTSTLDLPTATYFPTGMKSVGAVYDELTATEAIQRIGERDYEAGDESDATVVTDGTTTYYVLAEPVVTVVALTLSYLVDDFGTEQLLPMNGDEPTTSPLDAMIHYAMNAVDAITNMPNKVYRAFFDIKAFIVMPLVGRESAGCNKPLSDMSNGYSVACGIATPVLRSL